MPGMAVEESVMQAQRDDVHSCDRMNPFEPALAQEIECHAKKIGLRICQPFTGTQSWAACSWRI
jgi:hypothetical protein